MAAIFISFIHEEQQVALAIQEMLRSRLSADRAVFLSADDWQIHAGEVWLDRIKQELAEATVVLLLLSPASVGRPWVNFEAGAAWLAGKSVIPVCFGGLRKEALPKPYSNFQAVDLSKEYYYMVRSVHHWLNQSGHLRNLLRILPMPFDEADEMVVNLRTALDRLPPR